jgi:diaminopimelate decarboxylase
MKLDKEVLSAGISDSSPVYVYDLAALRFRCKRFATIMPEIQRIFFATMANDHPEVLACIHGCGFGAFVNSPAHLRLAQEAGFPAEQIIYAATNMLPSEMEMCVRKKVNLVLDSIGQVKTLGQVLNGRSLGIGVRLNVGRSTPDLPQIHLDPNYRFGLLPSEIPEAVAIARQAKITIKGAHSYFGTGLMSEEVLVAGLQRLAEAASALPHLEYLDVAGGMGVPGKRGENEFDIDAYGRQAANLLTQAEQALDRELTLFIEPGRYTVADCGYYFVKVVDCKVRPDRVFVGTTGSVATFPRPLIYGEQARHPCEIVEAQERPNCSLPIYVCGNSTYSQDFLAQGISLPMPEQGEHLVFHHAGAYCRSMFSNFLGKDRPDEVVLGSRRALRSVAKVS